MLLSMANPGDMNTIKRISGKNEVKKHLENLGFVTGSPVTVITQLNGDMVVCVKEARVAISREMANRIMV